MQALASDQGLNPICPILDGFNSDNLRLLTRGHFSSRDSLTRSVLRGTFGHPFRLHADLDESLGAVWDEASRTYHGGFCSSGGCRRARGGCWFTS